MNISAEKKRLSKKAASFIILFWYYLFCMIFAGIVNAVKQRFHILSCYS